VKRFLSLSVIFLISFSGLAQEAPAGLQSMIETRTEVADSIGAFYFYDSLLNIMNPRLKAVDTAIHKVHHYQALQRNGRTLAGLGNTGLAHTSLLAPEKPPLTSQFGITSFDAYRFTPGTIPYYKLNIPYTVLAYATGANREQVFTGRHYQQFRRNLGVGLGFNIYNTFGAYPRQKAENASFYAQALYRTGNERYGVAANFIANRFTHRENGGLANPFQFEANQEPARERVSIRLNNAENRWRESNSYVKQYFHITPPSTADSGSVRAFRELGSLVHTFNYQRLAMVYEDRNPTSGFYRDILMNNSLTLDSLVLHTYFNELLWNLNLIESSVLNFSFNAGIRYIHMDYRAFDINKKYNQVVPFFSPSLQLGSRISLGAHLEQVTGDIRGGDRELSAFASYQINYRKPARIKISLKNEAVSPALFYYSYQSNHFEWENNFKPQQRNHLVFEALLPNHSARVSYTNFGGFVYLDTLAKPTFDESSFGLIAAQVSNLIKWRRFTVQNHFTWQKLSSESSLRLPELVVNSVVAYELDLFDGALQAMGGVELFYNTAWKAPAYMPALRAFHLQDQRLTGNYLYADVFLNFRIRRARLFFIMQHVNQGLQDYQYYMIYNFPMPDRAFKFGVSWIFYD
jgi:hypothetical protein